MRAIPIDTTPIVGHIRPMTNYRRNFVPGGSYFFTVNLADRRLQLLTQHIEPLRAAFRYTQERHPFTVEAARAQERARGPSDKSRLPPVTPRDSRILP